MKLLLKLLSVLLAIFIVGGLFLPNTKRVERQIEIARPASFIYQFFNGFKRYNEWSPYVVKDPATQHVYSGPETGVGAKMAWTSKILGDGSQTVVEAKENQLVATDLVFDGGGGKAFYQLEPKGDSTLVRWAFESDAGSKFPANILGRWMNLLMDRFVGPDYEAGLANLKVRVEKLPNAKFGNFAVQRQHVAARSVLKINTQANDTMLDISQAYATAYGALSKALVAQGAQALTSAPLGFDLGRANGIYHFQAALSTETELKTDGAVVAETLPEADVLYAVHTGMYDRLENTASLLRAYAEVYGFKTKEPLVFAFVDDPTSMDPEAVKTELILYLAK
jgi:effector-binding domain-containing protein